MPEWLVVILLGLIEGITEFLPVSSTGHLLLAQQWLHPRQSDLFNVVIQSGAVLAVIVIFTDRLKQLAFRWREPEPQRYLAQLAAAFLVTAAGGLFLKKLGMELPETAAPVAWATLIGGIAFIAIERHLRDHPSQATVTWTIAIAIGFAQLAAAVFPGLSRSGATILVALLLGLSRPAAVEFSFLLGIPTLLAAGALETFSSLRNPPPIPENWGNVLLGGIVAAITAFLAVKWLLHFVRSHTFTGFGWYRIVLGALILALL